MEFKGNFEGLMAKARAKGVPVIRDQTADDLCAFVDMTAPETILEFGTGVGVSAILMHEVTPAKIDTIELDAARAKEAQTNFNKMGVSDDITLHTGDAFEVSCQMVRDGRKFDFVFLDSSKGQYIKLLPNIIKLLNPGGTMFADNVLFRGFVYGQCPKRYKTLSVRLRQFIDAAKNSDAFCDVCVYDTEDGFLVARMK